jgi:hypothetical protein
MEAKIAYRAGHDKELCIIFVPRRDLVFTHSCRLVICLVSVTFWSPRCSLIRRQARPAENVHPTASRAKLNLVPQKE